MSGKGKGRAKEKEKRDSHQSTITEGTTRAFPVERSCILMAWCEDREAQNLETVDERAKIVESLENIGGEESQRDDEGRKCS